MYMFYMTKENSSSKLWIYSLMVYHYDLSEKFLFILLSQLVLVKFTKLVKKVSHIRSFPTTRDDKTLYTRLVTKMN